MKLTENVWFTLLCSLIILGCTTDTDLVSGSSDHYPDSVLASDPLSVLNYDHTKKRVYLYEKSYSLGRPGCGDKSASDTITVASEVNASDQFCFTYHVRGGRWAEEMCESGSDCCTSFVSYSDSILYDTALIVEKELQCDKEITRLLLGNSFSENIVSISNWVSFRGDTLASWSGYDKRITCVQKIGLTDYYAFGSGNGWVRSEKIQLIRYDNKTFSEEEMKTVYP